MSTNMYHRPGSITTLADRAVAGADGDRPVRELLADLREEATVESAELRLEHGDDTDDGGPFVDADVYRVINYGDYSARIPLTRAALQFSRFDADEPVTVYAREGAVLLVSTRDAADPTAREVVAVELNVANVPTAVAALLDDHDARIYPETVEVTAAGTLAFSVVAPTDFERVTDHSLRTFGNGQISLTVPKDALDLSGLEPDDPIQEWATDGAVLFARQ